MTLWENPIRAMEIMNSWKSLGRVIKRLAICFTKGPLRSNGIADLSGNRAGSSRIISIESPSGG
jgi:hypothetical protein